MANTQNTVGGASDGGAVISTNGSPYLNFLTGLTDIANRGVEIYSSFNESQQAIEIAKQQAAAKPQQTVPLNMIDSPADLFSNPEATRRTFIVIAVGALSLAGVIWLVRRK